MGWYGRWGQVIERMSTSCESVAAASLSGANYMPVL